MEKVTKRQQAVLDILDEQIDDLETALAKVQPRIDELARLKRTRATLLSERSTTGSIGSNTRLTMEMMVNHFRQNDNEPEMPEDIAKALGVPASTVRSHLSRGKNTRYEHSDEGWQLIGEEEDE